MTARPMTEAERLAETLRFIAPDNNTVCWYGGPTQAATTIRKAADALLSTSAAVRGMREALKCIAAAYEDQDITHRAFRTIAGVAAVEALSGIEGEDEQARSPSALSASTPTVSKTFVVYYNIIRASSHLFHEEVVATSEDDARRIFKERHPGEFHVAREVEEKPTPISTDTKGTTK